ncbi:hypothetical protein U9M48_043869 [Paspalum notatum var. saurae]|uniref:Retrotransposon Copia-like N-terminal domain-containing protein n=1 Tax=Paspalum notatum var. saurae TaxID=547442 RepID=A0AAQ3UVS6_PASNO
MDPLEEEKRKEAEDAKKAAGEHSSGSGGEDNPLITKSELRDEMKSMIQGLLEMGLIGTRETRELKLELIPNDVKLEGSKNYLSWARRVQVILGGKGVEHYLEEDCVEPANKLSPEWRVWHTTNSTIVAWLLASMSPSVGKMVEAMRNAA